MIFARDKGQMCNNILQYAHVYAWGREHGKRTVSLRFCHKYRYFKICSTKYHNRLTYCLVKFAGFIGLLPVASFRWNGDNSRSLRMLEEKSNLIVEGWGVRFYELFLKYIDEIRSLFAFNENIQAKARQILQATDTEGGIRLGIHIRRGDYKTWQNGRYYYDDDVYMRFIKQFLALYPDRHITVIIAGNDPHLNESFYKEQLGQATVFLHGNPAEDLCMLSCCDFLIGAPSTFSLVAAMYHNRPLFWIKEKDSILKKDSFSTFDVLFRTV